MTRGIYRGILHMWEVSQMEVAKVFETGRSQAVRLPKKYRFQSEEVVVQRGGIRELTMSGNLPAFPV